jgi:hypothetical protein
MNLIKSGFMTGRVDLARVTILNDRSQDALDAGTAK